MILFNKPFVPDDAKSRISEALKSLVQQGDGYFSMKVQGRIQDLYSNYSCLLVPSCTAALEMSFMLMDLGPEDEVILPSFTFPSAATAITKFWARPIFCDVNPRDGNIDIHDVERLITDKTKAISWVNYGGKSPNLDTLAELASQYKLKLVEDSAHNFGLQFFGSRGFNSDFIAFSFHATKNIQCGEGGALLIKDKEFLEKALIVREKGTNRSDFLTGKASKYMWVGRGGSYLLSEVNSALLDSQLDHFEYIQEHRRNLVRRYYLEFSEIDGKDWHCLGGLEKAAHLFALIAPTFDIRSNLIEYLKSEGIIAVSHYEDLASSPAGKIFGRNPNNSFHSIWLSQRIVRLPLHMHLQESDIEFIAAKVKWFINQIQ